jgi:hypothetical protein
MEQDASRQPVSASIEKTSQPPLPPPLSTPRARCLQPVQQQTVRMPPLASLPQPFPLQLQMQKPMICWCDSQPLESEERETSPSSLRCRASWRWQKWTGDFINIRCFYYFKTSFKKFRLMETRTVNYSGRSELAAGCSSSWQILDLIGLGGTIID